MQVTSRAKVVPCRKKETASAARACRSRGVGSAGAVTCIGTSLTTDATGRYATVGQSVGGRRRRREGVGGTSSETRGDQFGSRPIAPSRVLSRPVAPAEVSLAGSVSAA
ncbi:hypothetical protein GCM10009759_73660 [Kitasatospora saccharophila]|uniref:Uncharacterized protein n=1 Tax=Kitasatospora saccharophila TaxID=407973 RepID=A0ABN2Y8K3_9ACTN